MGFDSPWYYPFLYALVCLFWYWRPSLSLLLGASLAFYAAFDARHLLLMLGLSVATYLLSFRVSEGATAAKAHTRARWLTVSLVLIFLPLLFYKLADVQQWRLLFPLGLSFYTFHCTSYLIDCHRGLFAAERSPKKALLYISFFPQLIAGPITRPLEIFPQLARISPPDRLAAERAVWRIYLGLFKKFTIANVLILLTREVFASPAQFKAPMVALAVLCGRYFIYSDFSGYCDIGIGSARLLGIRLPENFRRPFAATSIADYWRRWHITLSAWIRDYVFFPLTTSPLAAAGLYPLTIFTFLLLGLWHGVSWNFVLYGLWHGNLLVLHDLTRRRRERLWRSLGLEGQAGWVFSWLTFLLLVCPPTILFLTHTLKEALDVAVGMAQENGLLFVKSVSGSRFLFAILSVAFLEIYQWFQERGDCFERFRKYPAPLRWAFAAAALAWLAFAGEFSQDPGFLYFRF